jgi:hypothetical protein
MKSRIAECLRAFMMGRSGKVLDFDALCDALDSLFDEGFNEKLADYLREQRPD